MPGPGEKPAQIVITRPAYSPGDVADMLNAHKRTVLRWIKSGMLKCERITPAMYRIHADTLVELAERMGVVVIDKRLHAH